MNMPKKSIQTQTSETQSSSGRGELALTPIENFLWSSDAPDNPMIMRVILRFHGRVNAELFIETFKMALDRQPLLSSIVDERDGRPVWVPASHTTEPIWEDALPPNEPETGEFIEHIDLRKETGLRVRIISVSDGVLVRMDFQHATCDGQGARQLIADWLHLYDRIFRGEETSLTSLEPERLVSRGVIRPRPGIVPIGFREGLRNFQVTVCGRTARLPKRLQEPDGAVPGGSRIFERPLTSEQTAILRHRLQECRVTLNDLGIAVCLGTFARMFAVRSRHFISIMNPVDLRMPSDRYLPAANRLGFTYLRRRPKDCLSLPQLLESIQEQPKYIKDRFVGAEFVHALTAVDNRPFVYSFLRRISWFTPTLLFTRLGDTTRGRRYGFRNEGGVMTFGEMRLDRISAIAPVAPGVPVSVAACETNARLTLTVRSSEEYLTREQGDAFATEIISGILNWAGLPKCSKLPEHSE